LVKSGPAEAGRTWVRIPYIEQYKQLKIKIMIWTIFVLIAGIFIEKRFSPRVVIQDNKFQFSYKNSVKIRIYKTLFK